MVQQIERGSFESIIMIRQAEKKDKIKIVSCILDAFGKNFAEFISQIGKEKVQRFLEDSIRTDCFYIMERDGETIGVTAVSDSESRALAHVKEAARKNFGFIIGGLMYLVNFKEFETNYCDSKNVGYIEFVAIKQKFQNQGMASAMLSEILFKTDFEIYLLDVVDTNLAAIRCYKKIGFSEIRREKVRFSKQKGFQEKIFMEYKETENE